MSSRTATLKGRTSIGGDSTRSSSPPPSRAVDELRRQLVKVKGELETEKQKARQVQRNHAVVLKEKKDELERKHKLNLESISSRKEQEKVNELKLLEDRLNRQKDMEFRKLQREKNDELRELKLKLSKEHDIKLRSSLEAERQKLSDQYGGEDPSSAREAKLAREVFMRSEENEQMRDQMRLLKDENKDLLEQNRRMTMKHESEKALMLKQSRSEAARESARLLLAERRLMEREQEVIDVEQRVGYAEMEKETLVDEIEKLRKELENQQHRHAQEMSSSPSVHLHNQVQRRVNELEAHNKKLEQQLSEQRQEIASLRKKTPAVTASPMKHGTAVTSSMEDLSNVDRKALEKKLHDYRRRNKELLSLAKQLDGRQKALQIENDSLMESKSRDSTEAEKILRKQFVKQQIKERENHMKELRAKDKQIEALKKEVEKASSLVAEAKEVKTKSEEVLAIERNMKVISKERLQLEMQLGKLLKASPENGSTVAGMHASEMFSSKHKLDHLEEENRRIREELRKATEELSVYKGADMELENSSLKMQISSLKQQLEQQAKDIDEEVSHLNGQIKSLTEEKKTVEERAVKMAAELKRTAQNRHKTDHEEAQLTSLHQRLKELEEECLTTNKRLEVEESAHRESQKECTKLQKDLTKLKELQEVIRTRDEEKKQLVNKLDQLRKKEENTQSELEKLKASRKQESIAAKEKLVADNKKLTEESGKLKAQLSSQSKEVKKFEDLLKEAKAASKKLSSEVAEKEQETKKLSSEIAEKEREIKKLSSKVAEKEQEIKKLSSEVAEKERESKKLKSESKPNIPTKPVSTQCDLTGPTASSSPLAVRVAKVASDVSSSDHRRKASPTSGVVTSTGRRNTVATVPDHTKDVPESRQIRSVSIPTNPTDRATPTGRQNVRSIRPRPKSGGGRRSAGNIHWPVNRGVVPPYIAAAQGDNLQSELREAGMEVDDVFDSEAVKITESEMDFDAFGDDLLETTQSNISLDGFDTYPPSTERNPPSPVKSVSIEQSIADNSRKSSKVSSSESPESPSHANSAKVIHQVRASGDEQDDIIAVSNPSLPRLDECSEESASLQEEDLPPEIPDEQMRETASSSEASVFSPVTTPSGPVSLYRALYSYNPMEQSPNPNPETELELELGQMVIVYGDVREDGFFYGSVDGVKGLIPSNFVEKVKDLTEDELHEGRVSINRSPVWGLQDIAEEDELLVSPPSDLKLERQFVDQSSPDTFKAVISWTPPTPLPPTLSGYRVYVNNEMKATVSTETKVLLSDLPFNSTCSVVVCTLAGDRESDPTSPPIVIGAKFPMAPVNLKLSPAPGSKSLLLSWSDNSSSSPSAVPATQYTVSIDSTQVAQVEPTSTGDTRIQCLLSREALEPTRQNLEQEHIVTVRAHHYRLESQDSDKLIIDPSLLEKVFGGSLKEEDNNHSEPAAVESGGGEVVVRVDIHSPPPPAEPRPPENFPPKPEPTTNDATQHRFSILDMVGSDSESTSEMENGGREVVAHTGVHSPPPPAVPRPPEDTPPKPKRTTNDATQHQFSILDMVGSEDSESTSEMENGHVPSIDNVVAKAEGVRLREKRMSREERSRKGVATLLDLAADEDEESEDVNSEDDGSEGGEAEEDDEQVMFKEPRFYKAHTEYNPRFMSENVGMEDDELEFKAGDIIKVIGMEGQDWLIGQLRGHEGVVPVTFVDQVEDPELVQRYKKEFDSLLPVPKEVWTNQQQSVQQHQQHQQSQVNGDVNNRGQTAKKMVAMFDYDPEVDSPNDPEDIKDELKFSENDTILVYGSVDEFGFYKGELNGKMGLVPSNYLQPQPETRPAVTSNLMVIPSDEESIASESVDSEIDFLPMSTDKLPPQGVSVSQGR